MTTMTQCVELPEGYSVVDRLGAGGYGEVWKATAPGGLEKAVKVVFGHCDEGMAERELKSLERIKSVRHPFLLSIERYEIVNNRLVIVTELADMSLSDCFQNHIATGHLGIPRDQLISYLWDAAEALDCLIDQHSLQHLDIKPENLLLVGDHIKVADFGLVKELASQTLNSVMGGMTPLYSAPEIYDNNPSPRSDQYSLAIVYQHMLTGTLPFSGRTPAQLAKQHTLAVPNVNPLSEADRNIVRKALEKDPRDRFSSCREYVTALRSAGRGGGPNFIAAPAVQSSAQFQPISSDDTKSLSLIETKHLRDPVCVAATQRLDECENRIADLASLDSGKSAKRVVAVDFPVVDSEIVDVETPAFHRALASTPVPTLFVGIGGIGIKLLKAIRARVPAHDSDLAIAWLAIDTDKETLKSTHGDDDNASLAADDRVYIPLRRPNQYRDDSQALLQWVSRRWLYNIPRSLQTRGFRPLGRIAIVDHAAEVLTALHKRLHWLATQRPNTETPSPTVRVVVLAGMSGGTGSGTVVDVAQAVRSLCRDDSLEVAVQAVLGCTYHSDSNDSLAAANMYALLTEVTHVQREGNSGDSSPPGPAALFESPQRPFDEIFTVAFTGRSDSDLTLQSVANYLLLDASGLLRSTSGDVNSFANAAVENAPLRTFGCVNVAQLASDLTSQKQSNLLGAVIDHWLEPSSTTSDSDSRFFQTYSHSQFANKIFARFPEVVIASSDPSRELEINEQQSRRSAKIKGIATCFLRYLDTVKLQLAHDQSSFDQAQVAAASEQIVSQFCDLIEKLAATDGELVERLNELVIAEVVKLTSNDNTRENAALAEAAMAHFATGPLNCGYQRYTTLIEPSGRGDELLTQACRDRCPVLHGLESTVHETYLIREGSGLKALHLGARLAELYPDIADAAGRLHSRDDIKWCDLRATADVAPA